MTLLLPFPWSISILWLAAFCFVGLTRRAIAQALVLALLVIRAERAADAGLGLGDTGIGVEVDLLVFEAAPQPLDEDVVHVAAPRLRGGRLLPSMLMVMAWRFRVSVKSSLVNWLPPAFARAGSGRY